MANVSELVSDRVRIQAQGCLPPQDRHIWSFALLSLGSEGPAEVTVPGRGLSALTSVPHLYFALHKCGVEHRLYTIPQKSVSNWLLVEFASGRRWQETGSEDRKNQGISPPPFCL